MTYALATGIWRRRAAYRGTQDGTEHRIRHPGGTEFQVGWTALWYSLLMLCGGCRSLAKVEQQ